MDNTQFIIMLSFVLGTIMLIINYFIDSRQEITIEMAMTYPLIPIYILEEYGMNVRAIITDVSKLAYVVDSTSIIEENKLDNFEKIDNKIYLYMNKVYIIEECITKEPSESI